MQAFVKISLDDYSDMLDERFRDAQKWWGSEKTAALWEYVKDYILECAPYMDENKTAPKYIVDNYVVNSEIVSREEFETEDYYISNREDYETFDEYALNVGILYTEDYVLLNLGF